MRSQFCVVHIESQTATTFPQLFIAPPGVQTSPAQSLVDEVRRRAKVGSQVKVSAVGRRDTVVLEAHVTVELQPSVDVLRPVGGVQHVRYPQIDQQGFLLGCGAATENRIREMPVYLL